MIGLKPISPSLLTAVVIQVLCQVFKAIYYSIKNKKPEWNRLIHPGGMPSAHSAFVTALSISIGVYNGFDSELFAVAFVFSIIIIYDSIRLRGAVQIHSEMIVRLSRLLPREERRSIPLNVGHNLPEIAAGVLVGGVWAFIISGFILN
jgi:acid phosphatase family membrane protein YuiD